MPKVRVGDINLYYEIYGEGEPLVMINGAGATVEWMYAFIPVYSSEYRVILYDHRDTGKSDKTYTPHTIATMSDDLAGLLDAIGIDSVHVQGTSMGGMVAQEFALRHPEKVRSLTLMVAHCGGTHYVAPQSTDISSVLQLPRQEVTEALLRLFITEEFIEKNPNVFKQLIAFAQKHPIDPDILSKQMQAITTHDTYDRLPEIKAATLIIAGDADRIVPVENAHILASRIPHAELIIMKNAGHMLIEAAREVNRVTLDFLKRHKT